MPPPPPHRPLRFAGICRLGGGFKENDRIEYIDRNSDDEEFDEVGPGGE